jgi:Fe-S-cluster containining protein
MSHIPRRQVRPVGPPCAACAALCCRYLATEIDPPRTKRDYDDVRWYLLHRGVSVFLDAAGSWFLAFDSPCLELDADGRCRRYAVRPRLCREHGRPPNACEHDGPLYSVRFATVTEFEHWLDAQGIDWRYRSARRRSAARAPG